jgi:signal peptidase II
MQSNSHSFLQKLKTYSLFWPLTLFIFIADQASKFYIARRIPAFDFNPANDIILIPGWLQFIHVRNTGAAWSLFSGYPWALAILGIVMLCAMFFFRRTLELQKRSMQLAFGLMAGGILGNLTDRLRFGYVIDFIDVHLPFYHWPTFNIGDCGISIGVLLYLLIAFLPTVPTPKSA